MNHSVVRDPPKAGRLRRIDKVADTNEVTLRVAEADDRLNSNIAYYPRGVNPAVTIDFGNNGSNGGMMATTQQRRQSYAPYRLRDVFRPPIVPQSELLPLSRQARGFTSVPSSVYDPRYDTKLSRMGGCTEANISAFSRDVKKAVARKQCETGKAVAHAFTDMPTPQQHQILPFISDSAGRNLASRHTPNANYAAAFHQYVVHPDDYANSATARMGDRLRGTLNTNPSGLAASQAFSETDFRRLIPRASPDAPTYPHYNMSKPLVY